MLRPGDKIGLVACSNGLGESQREKYDQLIQILKTLQLEIVSSPYLFEKQRCDHFTSGKERARWLMSLYEDKNIKMIFDISGGDIANEVISYLDWKTIRKSSKPFWGYSDLTTLLNAIYTMTGECGYLYQLRNLVGSYSKMQEDYFKEALITTSEEKEKHLFNPHFEFIQGEQMSGIVVGGNMRCFLKLAGTPYMPDLTDKVLLLEARGGKKAQMITYLHQLKQLGAFEKVKGILLGTFTVMDQEEGRETIEALVKEIVGNPCLPIAGTKEIGHGEDSKCIRIGKSINIIK